MKNFLIVVTLFLIGSQAHAQTVCNSPSGWIQSFGSFNLGDTAVFGPDCNHIQDGNAITPLPAWTFLGNMTASSGTPQNVPMPVIYPATPVTFTTLQAAINAACPLPHAIVQIPTGNWSIDTTSGPITIANCQTLIIQGSGGINSGAQNGSQLINTVAANDLFDVTTPSAVTFRDFAITNSVTKNAGTAVIRFNDTTTGLAQQIVERMAINGGCTSIEVDNSLQFIIRDNLLTSFNCEGITITQPSVADQGNNIISGNKIWDVVGNAGADACILWHRGSGVRVMGNRCLGAFNYGLHIKFDNVTQSDGAMIVSNNTFEVQKLSGIYLERTSAAQSAGTTIGQMVFTSNFIQSLTSGGSGSINITNSGASPWVLGCVIEGNSIQNTIIPAFNGIIEIDGADQCNVSGNMIYTTSPGTGGIRVSGASTNTTIANNINATTTPTTKYPSFTASTTLLDLAGMTVANLPLTVQDGSIVYTTDGSPTVPISGGGTGALAMHVNGAWQPARFQLQWGIFTHIGYTASITQATTIFMNGYGHESTETPAEQLMPNAVTLTNMRCQNSSVGGAGQSVTYTLEKNGSDQALTVSIPSGSTFGSDTTHSVTYSAANSYSVKMVTSATTGNITGAGCSFTVSQ